MNKRFNELLDKLNNPGLTDAEKAELVTFINEPIMNPTTRVLASKHQLTLSDVPGRIGKIEWFAKCGQPLVLDLSFPFSQLHNWSEAIGSMSPAWENAQLRASNQLSVWLHNNHRAEYQSWNGYVRSHQGEVLNPLTEDKLAPYQEHNKLPNAVVNSIEGDLLGALMENTYLPLGHQCFFFLELLWVYEAGHFPCGWIGDWPQGELKVF